MQIYSTKCDLIPYNKGLQALSSLFEQGVSVLIKIKNLAIKFLFPCLAPNPELPNDVLLKIATQTIIPFSSTSKCFYPLRALDPEFMSGYLSHVLKKDTKLVAEFVKEFPDSSYDTPLTLHIPAYDEDIHNACMAIFTKFSNTQLLKIGKINSEKNFSEALISCKKLQHLYLGYLPEEKIGDTIRPPAADKKTAYITYYIFLKYKNELHPFLASCNQLIVDNLLWVYKSAVRNEMKEKYPQLTVSFDSVAE
jgi:hypothetical protein